MSLTITELFQRDPTLNDAADFERIIEHFRANRRSFMLATASWAKPANSKKVEAAAAVATDLGLGSLELDL